MSITTTPIVYRPAYHVVIGTANSRHAGKVFYPTNILSIQTDKQLGGGAGAFEIVFNYERYNKEGSAGKGVQDSAPGETWGGILVPNDYVEIWMERVSSNPMKIVLRGFIDNVRVVEAGQQSPQPRVIISGRDYGKLPLICSALSIDPYMPATVVLQYFYHIDLGAEGLGNTNLPKFVRELMTKIIQPYLDFHKKTIRIIPDFDLDTSTLEPYVNYLALVNINADQVLQVVWNVIDAFRNKPWTEFFVRDDDDKPRFVLRFPPLRESDLTLSTPIGDGYPVAVPPPIHVNAIADWAQFAITRMHRDVLNWFFTMHSITTGGTTDSQEKFITPGLNPYIIGTSIDEYALQKMQPTTTFLTTAQGGTKTERDTAVADIKSLVAQMNLWLAKVWGYNYALLNGSITLRGQPVFQVGNELGIDIVVPSGLPSSVTSAGANFDPTRGLRFYIEGVAHQFTWGQTWNTTLTATRGMPYDGFGVGYAAMTPYLVPTTYPSDADFSKTSPTQTIDDSQQ